MHCFVVFVACCSVSEVWCPAGAAVFGCGSDELFVYGGCRLLALSKSLTCKGFQNSEFWCAFLFDVCYVFFECQTIVVCDF